LMHALVGINANGNHRSLRVSVAGSTGRSGEQVLQPPRTSDPYQAARGTSDTSQQRHGTSKAVGQLGHVLTCTITESQG
jgi:protein involved in polysaccharide export with SLBB domain